MTQIKLTFEVSLLRIKGILDSTVERKIIGIVGKPGAGKSTLTDFLMSNLPTNLTSLLPMDGYHLSNYQLEQIDLQRKKGAPNTFDVNGYIALLERIKNSNQEVYFPVFHREIEESIAAEGVIREETKLIITEGNYLLSQEFGWSRVRQYLFESWYVETEDSLRLERLVRRHHKYGKQLQDAFDWAHGSDEENASIVEASKEHADVIVSNDS